MNMLQRERDALLLYILQNPPKNVTILLPPGAKGAADLKISCAANPLPLYAKASATNPVEVDLRSVPLLGSSAVGPSSSTHVGSKLKFGGPRFVPGYFMKLLNSYRLTRETEEPHSSTLPRWKSSQFANKEIIGRSTEAELPAGSNSFSAPESRCVSLPLEGNDSRTLSEYVAPLAEKREVPQWDPTKFLQLPTLEFFPLIDGSMLADLMDEEDRVLVVYEHMLMVTAATGTFPLTELSGFLKTYRDIAGISEEQHNCSLESLLLRGQNSEALELSVAILERLVKTSSDEAFVLRMRKVLCICRDYPDNPNECADYPLALRAFLFAGALQVMPKWEKRTTQRKGSAQELTAALRKAFHIPIALEPFCLFHGNIFAKSDAECTPGAQREFLKGVAKAINALPTRHLSSEPLTAETKYKLFLLQETFEASAAPMQLIGGNHHDQVLLCLSALFVESCLSLPSEFLSVCVRVDGQSILPPASSANDFLLMLLMIFIEQSILSEFGTIKLLHVGTPEHLLKPLCDIGKRPCTYCELLSVSLKNIGALVLPGVAKAGSHVLARYWKDAIKNNEIPVDFADGIKALLALLVQFTTETVVDDEEICRVLAASGNIVFRWIAENSNVNDKVTNEHNEAKYSELINPLLTPKITQSGKWFCLPYDAYQTVDIIVRQFTAPRPPPLVPDPNELVRSRLYHTSHCLERIASVLQGNMQLPVALTEVHPNVAPAHQSYLHDYRLLFDGAERIRALGAPPFEDLILRLQCLARIQLGWQRTVRHCAKEYADVRLVTGAPAFPFDDFLLIRGEGISQNAETTMCEFAAVAIVHSELGELLGVFMRTNLSVYRRLKRDKSAVAERRHLIREFPNVTMEMILNKLNIVFSTCLSRLESTHLREEVCERTGQHFVAALYNIYLNGTGRFFVPEDWEGIAQDLDSVEAFLLKNSGQDEGGREKAEEVRRHSLVLLGWLRQIVRYCFSQTSEVLVEGSDGVPRLAHLPDTSKTSPWCKYVVRRVLEHRKDKAAKSSTASKFFRVMMDEL